MPTTSPRKSLSHPKSTALRWKSVPACVPRSFHAASPWLPVASHAHRHIAEGIYGKWSENLKGKTWTATKCCLPLGVTWGRCVGTCTNRSLPSTSRHVRYHHKDHQQVYNQALRNTQEKPQGFHKGDTCTVPQYTYNYNNSRQLHRMSHIHVK